MFELPADCQKDLNYFLQQRGSDVTLTAAQQEALKAALEQDLKTVTLPLTRAKFAKVLRIPALITERTCYLDCQRVALYESTKKEKLKIGLERNYGPLKDLVSSPLRKEFVQAFTKKDLTRCKEIILALQFRQICDQAPQRRRCVQTMDRFLELFAREIDIAWFQATAMDTIATIAPGNTADSAGHEQRLRQAILPR